MTRSIERKNTRMKKWDYSSSGWYFVTICIKNRECVFGDVKEGKMQLNNLGKLAQKCWIEISVRYQNVEIEQFVVMPNHIHGIVVIKNNENICREKEFLFPNKNTIERRRMKLSTIIGSLKSGVSRENNKMYSPQVRFKWQSSFHDHIIRNETELINIQNYINSNPENWRDDDFWVQSD